MEKFDKLPNNIKQRILSELTIERILGELKKVENKNAPIFIFKYFDSTSIPGFDFEIKEMTFDYYDCPELIQILYNILYNHIFNERNNNHDF